MAFKDGGVIYSGEGSIKLIGHWGTERRVSFDSNSALNGNGGVVYCMKGDVIINTTTFSNNSGVDDR